MLVLAKAERDAAGGSSSANASQDVQFLRDIAHANLAEIAAGKLAAGKAASAEVRKYGQQMVDDHTQANARASALAKARGFTLPKDAAPTEMAAAKSLEALSGVEFDRAYVAQRIKQHGEAASLLERAAAEAQDADLRAYAESAAPEARKHLQAAQRLKR
jgi:putative membrane protein